jgi:hypothetical protein
MSIPPRIDSTISEKQNRGAHVREAVLFHVGRSVLEDSISRSAVYLNRDGGRGRGGAGGADANGQRRPIRTPQKRNPEGEKPHSTRPVSAIDQRVPVFRVNHAVQRVQSVTKAFSVKKCVRKVSVPLPGQPLFAWCGM